MSEDVKMIDISMKPTSLRVAKAEGFIKLKKETIELIKKKKVKKGDVINVAKVAAILAVKHTWEIIPLCHPIPITSINIDINVEDDGIRVTSEVKAYAKTGVEMEALIGASIALLTIWDMVKAYEKDEKGQYPFTEIKYIRVIEKVKRV